MTDPVFFRRSRNFTAGEIAAITGARLASGNDAQTLVTGIAPLSEGGEGMLVFIDSQKRVSLLRQIAAAAVLCPAELAGYVPAGMAILESARPQADFATIARLLYPASVRPGTVTGETGISRAAHVSPQAEIEPGAIIEAGAVIGSGAAIGSETVIGPNAMIGPGVQIGRQGFVGANASIMAALIGNRVIIHPGARIGQDGFGYVVDGSGLNKIPQLGRVVIQDDVEIGANTTIDRGAMEDTIIGEGTKIDNLVQIGHNVRIGRHCAIAGQCGISGTVKIGDGVLLGGRVGVVDHITIGPGARLAAGSGVLRDVPAGVTWSGYPARPLREFLRETATLAAMTSSRRKNGAKQG